MAFYTCSRLERLSTAFVFDAENFFRPFEVPRKRSHVVWERLRHLALTSKTLLHTRLFDFGPANEVLSAAGAAMAYLPALDVMEPWYADDQRGFLFRYDLLQGRPIITVETTRNFELKEDTLRVWRNVVAASRYHQYELKVVLDMLPPQHTEMLPFWMERLTLRDEVQADLSG
ncbi:hypothetical protein Cob_v011251 [Colletotrichum orbiculare MAFF 240422]|uniref:DUF6546 domain-containing protein n=1 Tax=Colletotrichum orbiculare (strain 104-T / ATCC 96160 / CBS 514.97 / LARS 414 / MAFF 240422) TaxID=1213857 RepID=A0A484FE42_COLOR|nr:hypothetical protein Cob_v011251 [Colletotrichum orbiculare MAFF 240422]